MTDDKPSESDRIKTAALAGALVSLLLPGWITWVLLSNILEDDLGLGVAVAIWFGWAVVLGVVFYQTGWPNN